MSNDCFDSLRRSRIEDIIIAQRGTAKVLLPSDSLYEEGIEFWGGHCGDFETGLVQGDSPAVDVHCATGETDDLYDWWS